MYIFAFAKAKFVAHNQTKYTLLRVFYDALFYGRFDF